MVFAANHQENQELARVHIRAGFLLLSWLSKVGRSRVSQTYCWEQYDPISFLPGLQDVEIRYSSLQWHRVKKISVRNTEHRLLPLISVYGSTMRVK